MLLLFCAGIPRMLPAGDYVGLEPTKNQGNQVLTKNLFLILLRLKTRKVNVAILLLSLFFNRRIS